MQGLSDKSRLSRPVRALWIEMDGNAHLNVYELVEAREGLVD